MTNHHQSDLNSRPQPHAVINNRIKDSMQHNIRDVPSIRNVSLRTSIGFFLLVLSIASACSIFPYGRIDILILISTFPWAAAVFLTHKYIHKYPQRYFSYLIASHFKAAVIMAFFLWIMGWIAGPAAVPHDVLWTGYVLYVFADILVPVPRSRDNLGYDPSNIRTPLGLEDTVHHGSSDLVYSNKVFPSTDKYIVPTKIRSELPKPLIEFIESNLPDNQARIGDVALVDDIDEANNQYTSVSLLIGRTRINDVRRLNRFLQFCARHITMGGYLALNYIPLENVKKELRERYEGFLFWSIFILHFLWYRAIPKIPLLDRLYFSPKIKWLDSFILSITKKRNRALSKAEVWGRLSFCGMVVIAEEIANHTTFLIAKRVAKPVQNKGPSYYPIVSLEKVGLGGKIIHTHKIRTMYPFSEFIQKRIYEDHGLNSTGKFANDFRLTRIGVFLRKYWLDELPQIFDWLRGDIKLVGIRATSPHFLSLYPKYFIELYIQTKPGLIPPIFDEGTDGFERIVETELSYLQQYQRQPIRTDIQYFLRTFTDIVFRGVRSK